MEQTLEIIEIISGVFVLIFWGTILWQIRSNSSIPCIVTQLVITAILFALEIPCLILQTLLHQSYGITILFLCFCSANVSVDAFNIGKRIGKKSASMNSVATILDEIIIGSIIGEIIERSQEDDSENSDDNR